MSTTDTSDLDASAAAAARADEDLATARDAIPARFDAFRAELDAHHDRRERLVKASRDITIASKRVIFQVHRLAASADLASASATSSAAAAAAADAGRPQQQQDNNPFAAAGQQGFAKLADVQAIFRGRVGPELRIADGDGDGDAEDGSNSIADAGSSSTGGGGDSGLFWRYQAAISPGLQEYIEAFAFAFYLTHGTLATRADVARSLTFPAGDGDGDKGDGGESEQPLFPIPLDDYLLGVSDLTGELMRLAITSIARRGGRATARTVSDFVRNCKAGFGGFTPYVRGLSKKQDVTAQSLLKIEEAAYAIAVRTREYGVESEEMLEDIVGRCVSDVQRREYPPHGHGPGGFEDGSGRDREVY